jgi:drug/metabolite transporter (DMT)-like permease
MSFLPILAGLSAALFWGLSDYLVTAPSRKIGQNRATAYVMLFSTLTLLPAVLYAGINVHISLFVLFLAFLSSISAFLGFLFAYRAFRYGNLSITAPIVGSYPAVVVLGAVFILGDVLSGIQIASISAIIVGVILLSTKLSAFKAKRKVLAVGVGSAVLSMAFLGLPGIFAGAYTVVIGYALLSIMWRSVSSGLGFVVAYITKQELAIPFKKQIIVPVIAAGITDAFGILAFMYAIFVKSSGLPIVAALSGFAGGITVILALALLKERPEKNQLVGIFLAVIGVVILSYFS